MMNLWGDGTIYSDPSVQGLDQETLARLLGIRVQGNNPMEAGGGFTLDVGQDPTGMDTVGPSYLRNILRKRPDGMVDIFDPQTGQYVQTATEDSGSGLLGALTKAMVLGGVGAGLTSVAGAAGAGSGAAAPAGGGGSMAGAGGWTAAVPGEMAASLAGMPAATVTPGLLSSMPALEIAGTAAAGGAAGSGLLGGGGAPAYTTAAADSQLANAAGIGSGAGGAPAGVNLTNAGGLMSTGSGFNWSDFLTDPSNWLKVAGAVAGAQAGKDQTQSQNRDPWGPAQPFLQDVITQGRGLLNQYMTNPVSPTQKQAYQNQFGLLNAVNQMSPGMFSNFGALGQSTYDRSNPRGRTLNTTQQSLPQFAGLLNPWGNNNG